MLCNKSTAVWLVSYTSDDESWRTNGLQQEFIINYDQIHFSLSLHARLFVDKLK